MKKVGAVISESNIYAVFHDQILYLKQIPNFSYKHDYEKNQLENQMKFWNWIGDDWYFCPKKLSFKFVPSPFCLFFSFGHIKTKSVDTFHVKIIKISKNCRIKLKILQWYDFTVKEN